MLHDSLWRPPHNASGKPGYGKGERLAHLIKQEDGRAKKQAFARRIGVKPQQLSRYLKGQLPDALTLLAIAEVGQVSVDWLLTLQRHF